MKTKRRTVIVVLATLFLLLSAPLWAQDPTLESVKLGKHVYGEKWDLEGLKGRTVFLYFWDLA
ncbi:MAG: hypothetical protein ACYTHM_25020 [Planctomycetota bacterium]|jgi:hypothetical protein